LDECINVNYNDLTDTKYLPMPEEQENAVIVTPDEKELYGTITSKVKAREMQNRTGRLKKELEKQKENLEKVINGKIKTLYAIETYLGVYEEIEQLASGPAASPDEPITVYQQKCYMDEEVSLTEVDGYAFSQGFDYEDIGQFDSWIVKRYKRYLCREKSIMAWEIRRRDKDYNDKYENQERNLYNHLTYYLIRNGENLYRIFSGVGIQTTLFPTKEKWKAYSRRIKNEVQTAKK
jgi:hypothetical protein